MYNHPQGKAMEFKKEDIVIVDEKKTNIFEKQEVEAPKQPEPPKKNNWIDAYSDCA